MPARTESGRMKILLVGDYPPPQGGIAVHVEQLRGFLRRRSIETQVLDIGKGGQHHPGVLQVRTRRAYARELVRFASRGWLIHLHVTGHNRQSWWIMSSVVMAGKVFGRPPVITLHSGLFQRYLAASAFRRFRARVVLAGAGRVIAVSEEIRSALASAGVPASRISVHPAFCGSMIDPGPPPEGFDSVRKRHRPLLAMANHPSAIYGRPIMLRALEQMIQDFPAIGLAFFGPSLGQAPKAGESAGPLERIHDFGEVRHSAALGLISNSDVFVRPTTADGDSVSVREALALGVRCVASDVVPRPWGTTLFRTGDAKDLAQRIAEALRSEAARAEPADAGPALVDVYESLSPGARDSSLRASDVRASIGLDRR